MNSWLARCVEQDVPCVSAQRQIERDENGEGEGRAQRGGREPLSRYESLFVLLKNPPFRNKRAVSSPFLPLLALWEQTSAQYHGDTTSPGL